MALLQELEAHATGARTRNIREILFRKRSQSPGISPQVRRTPPRTRAAIGRRRGPGLPVTPDPRTLPRPVTT